MNGEILFEIHYLEEGAIARFFLRFTKGSWAIMKGEIPLEICFLFLD